VISSEPKVLEYYWGELTLLSNLQKRKTVRGLWPQKETNFTWQKPNLPAESFNKKKKKKKLMGGDKLVLAAQNLWHLRSPAGCQGEN